MKIINSVKTWQRFREERNNTTHMYDHTVAQSVFVVPKEFARELAALIDVLQQRLSSTL